jgi:hypothetical protein
MKTVNSLSSGKSSSYLAVNYEADYDVFACVCIDDPDSKPKDPAILKYAQNKLSSFNQEYGEFIATAEDVKSLKVMMDLEQLIGREITWVRDMSFDDVISIPGKTRLPGKFFRYCTQKMKIEALFKWWFHEIGVKCKMRIGFRFDEFNRMIKFFNNTNPTEYKFPISCKNYGNKNQKHKTFNWRHVEMPLIKDGITKDVVNDFWDNEQTFGSGLFEEKRKIEFPVFSNCKGCFWKDEAVIAAEAEMNPEVIRWFAKQETKGNGIWRDDGITYQDILDNPHKYGKEKIFEARMGISSCDSEGCTA